MNFALATYLCATVVGIGNDRPLQLIDEAKQEYRSGEIKAAFDRFDEARVALFQMVPLQLKSCLLVQSPGEAYGVYQSRENNVYEEGDSIYLYCEPVGYTFQKKNDLYQLSLTADFALVDEKLHVLASEDGFASFNLLSHKPNTELMLNIAYKFSGMRPGQYFLKTTVKDAFSDKTVVHTLPVVFK